MKKEILVIQQNLSGGGAEKVLVDILNHMDYENYQVTLLVLFGTGVYMCDIPASVSVLNLYRGDYSKISYILKKYSLNKIRHEYQRRKIRRLLVGKKFDTIVSFMEGQCTIYHSYIFDLANRNLTWVHIDLFTNNWCLSDFDSFEQQKNIYDFMDDVVFVSAGARDAFNKLFQTSRSTIVYNLIDEKDIKQKANEFNVKKNKITICNVGRLAPQKRQDRIVEVARILKDKGFDLEFWILGTGPLEAILKEKVTRMSLEDTVFFKGFQKNPQPYVMASDIFLLTSDSEGFPLVVCEALCLGKAIVSTKVVGPSELLENGAGILVNCEVTQIADAIENLLKNPEKLQDLEKAARSRCSLFAVDKTMQSIYSLLS